MCKQCLKQIALFNESVELKTKTKASLSFQSTILYHYTQFENRNETFRLFITTLQTWRVMYVTTRTIVRIQNEEEIGHDQSDHLIWSMFEHHFPSNTNETMIKLSKSTENEGYNGVHGGEKSHVNNVL